MIDILDPLTLLGNAIRKCIISEDEISDDASSTLRDIRRKKIRLLTAYTLNLISF